MEKPGAETAPTITEADYQEFKRIWRSDPLVSFLVRHAICVGALGFDDGVTASFEGATLAVWCRRCGDTLEQPNATLPPSRTFWNAVCTGIAIEHPPVFLEDLTGGVLSRSVNRLAAVLRRAEVLSWAGGKGSAVHCAVSCIVVMLT